jgi:hypothetical protein
MEILSADVNSQNNVVLLSRKKDHIIHLLCFDENVLENDTCHKHPGVTLKYDGTWKDHTNDMCTK